MKTEFEVKILDIDVAAVKKKLDGLGAVKVAERKMRRFVYDIGLEKSHSWIRLRDNGEKTTLTIKEIHSSEIDGTKEIEVEVSDFDSANSILNKLGFFPKAYQENKRVSFRLDGAEVEIDSWPKIPPYVEIEAGSAEKVEKVLNILGFEKSQATSIGVEEVYKKYGINIHDFKELKF
ncbi:MAG: class IV adenylate cyclase [Candidatus Diapherotrites archaeon]|nr:class IV adenylate cyclase [Candidatus Diapherotrites archaeon]